jgi:hypothetical protein
MKSSSYLNWFRRLLVLGAVIAGATASAVGASVARPPDVQDTASAVTAGFVGSPPDVRDTAATLNVAVPDVLERFAVAHPYGSGLSASSISRPPDIQDTAAVLSASGPDVLERYATAHPYGVGLSSTSTPISRPPDVRDAAQAVQSGSFSQALSQASGFHWSDWAIGIGTGMGLILLLAGGLVMGRQVRHGVQTA